MQLERKKNAISFLLIVHERTWFECNCDHFQASKRLNKWHISAEFHWKMHIRVITQKLKTEMHNERKEKCALLEVGFNICLIDFYFYFIFILLHPFWCLLSFHIYMFLSKWWRLRMKTTPDELIHVVERFDLIFCVCFCLFHEPQNINWLIMLNSIAKLMYF